MSFVSRALPNVVEENRLRYIIFLMWLWAGAIRGFAQDSEQQPATNLETLRWLARKLATEISSDFSKSDSVRALVTIQPKESAWYIENAVVEGLRTNGATRVGDPLAFVRLELGIGDAGVEYTNIRKEGLFGTKVVERKVRLTLDSKLIRVVNGVEHVGTRTLTDSQSDVVEVSVIPRLENSTIPITQGTLPRESLFSNLVEPLVVIGSLAIVVFLLFNVRS